jgi:hypothetical protein
MNDLDLFQSYNIKDICYCDLQGLFKSHDLFLNYLVIQSASKFLSTYIDIFTIKNQNL